MIIVGDQDGNSLGCGEADRREVKYRGPSYTERVYSETRDSRSYVHFEELSYVSMSVQLVTLFENISMKITLSPRAMWIARVAVSLLST